MNAAVEQVVTEQITVLANLIKENPAAILQMYEDGSGWDLNVVSMPEDIRDKDIDKWVEENNIASSCDCDMPSPEFDFTNDILMQAMAMALGLKMESY